MDSTWLFKQFIFLFETLLLLPLYSCSVISLDANNIDTVLENNQVVFVNFYADWCRFSRMLAPVFEEASNVVAREFTKPGSVVFGKVDCDNQPNIAQKYHVNKYPTMKLFRGGQLVKREYRGQRSAESLANYVRDQLKDPIQEFQSLDEVYELSRDKRRIIGYFTDKETLEYETFEKVGKILKDDCNFHVGFGEASKAERTTGDNIIFKPVGDNAPEMVYLGSLTNYDLLMAWSQDKCIPLVREITFQNGEELTEEGLPFLILFHKKEDTESLETYKKEVSRLVSFKSSINFLVADCSTFSHPLHHLGKTVRDCPLVAIDSFKHMYMFPNFDEISIPGKLKQFILDLHSGKLHREFHHGPDPVPPSASVETPEKKPKGFHLDPNEQLAPNQPRKRNIENETDKKKPNETSKKVSTTASSLPPKKAEQKEKATTIKSVFVKMKPSVHRYTIIDKIKDEL